MGNLDRTHPLPTWESYSMPDEVSRKTRPVNCSVTGPYMTHLEACPL